MVLKYLHQLYQDYYQECNIVHAEYTECIRLLNDGQLLPHTHDGNESGIDLNEMESSIDRGGVAGKLHVNQQNLQRAWTNKTKINKRGLVRMDEKIFCGAT